MNITPFPGERYHYRNGGIYTVICIATEEATEKLFVVYQSYQGGECRVMPMNEFMDGRFWRASELMNTIIEIVYK